MSESTLTHWKKLTNPDYIGAYAFNPGEKKVVTVKSVGRKMVKGPDGKEEECTICYFNEAGIKPMILNSTNSKTITKLADTPYIENWAGTRLELYVTKVNAFGDKVEAVRISPVAPPKAEKVKAAITPGTKAWEQAVERKATLEQINQFYTITEQHAAEYTAALNASAAE